jgi:hypothetical protein
VTEIFQGRVGANGQIDESVHPFVMAEAGVAEARLSDISPPTSRLEITLCQGNFVAAGTCGPFSSAEGTDTVRAHLAPGTNTAYVTKARGDAHREPSSYTLTLVHPR